MKWFRYGTRTSMLQRAKHVGHGTFRNYGALVHHDGSSQTMAALDGGLRRCAAKPCGDIGGVETVAGTRGIDRCRDTGERNAEAIAFVRNMHGVAAGLQHRLTCAEMRQAREPALAVECFSEQGAEIIS